MKQLIEIAFSGFWPFIGVLIILYNVLLFIRSLWIRLLRMIMVKKHGWPPPHLDADGNWNPNNK